MLLTALALTPALAIIGFNEISLRHSREAEVHEYALRMGELASLEMQRVLTGVGALIVAVGIAPAVEEGEARACNAYLSRVHDALPQIDVISVTALDGTVRCTTGQGGDEQRVENDEELRDLLRTQMVAIGEYVETSTGKGLSLGGQIRDRAGNLVGFVIVAISLDWLAELMQERTFSEGGALTIADRNGIIIAREPFPERFVGTRIPDEFMHLVNGTGGGTISVLSQDGTQRIIGYSPANTQLGLYISAGVSQVEAFRSIDDSTRNGLALAAAGGAVAFFISWLFGRAFINRPVLQLTTAIARWRSGDHQARTGMSVKGMELHRVGAALDTMLDQLETEQRAREQAERHRNLLIAELDHRLKNMLTTAQALATQTFREERVSKEALRAFLARLLALSKAHDLLAREQWNSARLSEVIAAVLSVFEGPHRDRFSTSGPDLPLNAKAALALAMALHELSTNAAKYGALSNDAGTVEVSWSVSGAEDGERFNLHWVETGGPVVAPPAHRGFGSQMIEKALAGEISGSVEVAYEPGGLQCRITCPVAAILERQPG